MRTGQYRGRKEINQEFHQAVKSSKTEKDEGRLDKASAPRRPTIQSINRSNSFSQPTSAVQPPKPPRPPSPGTHTSMTNRCALVEAPNRSPYHFNQSATSQQTAVHYRSHHNPLVELKTITTAAIVNHRRQPRPQLHSQATRPTALCVTSSHPNPTDRSA